MSIKPVIKTTPESETKIPAPQVQKANSPSQPCDLYKDKKVEQLGSNPLVKTAEQPKFPLTEKQSQIQQFLQDATSSTFDRLKKLLPIPASILPILDLILGKKPSGEIKAGIAHDCISFTTDLKMPSLGVQGTAVLNLPLTEQSPQDTVTKLHPEILALLDRALSSDSTSKEGVAEAKQRIEAIKTILTTLPSHQINFSWNHGTAIITVTLPNKAVLVLNLTIPQESEQAALFLKEMLQAVLKENYQAVEMMLGGVATLLDKDILFKFDGTTSKFAFEFPEQLALKINKLAHLPLDLPSVLNKIIGALGTNTTIVLPKRIGGTLNFENPGIQFDPNTTFLIKNAPLPDITLDRISLDPSQKKMFLTLKTSWIVIPDARLKNLEIDLSEKPEKKKTTQTPTKPFVFDFAFITCEKKTSKKADAQQVTPPVKTVKPSTVSVFQTVKKMIQIPEAFSPLFDLLFADQTQVDVSVGLEDHFQFSGAVHLSNLGITGKASISLPTSVVQGPGRSPVKLPPQIEEALAKLVASQVVSSSEKYSAEEALLLNDLFDLILTLPNQTISIRSAGEKVILDVTLPGNIQINLELDHKKIDPEKDTLRTELMKALNSPLPTGEYTQLLEIVNTLGNNDFRKAELLRVIKRETDKQSLQTQLVKVLERDIVRTKLSEKIGTQFDALEPYLDQNMSFTWNPSGLKDGFAFTGAVNMPNLGIAGKVQITLPTTPQSFDLTPVNLPPHVREALTRLVGNQTEPKSAEETKMMNTLINFVLNLPHQNLSLTWNENRANLFVTLPGGISVQLELDVTQIENGLLRAALLDALKGPVPANESPESYYRAQLTNILNTFGKDDFRYNQLLKAIQNTPLEALPAKLIEVLNRDILRTKLCEMLGGQFKEIEQLVDQTFTFKWEPSTKEFQLKFLQEQELQIKSLNLKKGGFLWNLLGKIIGKLTRNRTIILPRELIGTIDFEKCKINFKKGVTHFVAKLPFGLSKQLSLRTIFFKDPTNIELGIRGFFRTWGKSIDTTTSDFDTPLMAIHPSPSVAKAKLRDQE